MANEPLSALASISLPVVTTDLLYVVRPGTPNTSLQVTVGNFLAAPTPIGSTTASTGAFTTLTASTSLATSGSGTLSIAGTSTLTGNVGIGGAVPAHNYFAVLGAVTSAVDSDNFATAYINGDITVGANNQIVSMLNIGGSFTLASGAYTGLSWVGIQVNGPAVQTGSGNGARYMLYLNGNPGWSGTNYAIYSADAGAITYLAGHIQVAGTSTLTGNVGIGGANNNPRTLVLNATQSSSSSMIGLFEETSFSPTGGSQTFRSIVCGDGTITTGSFASLVYHGLEIQTPTLIGSSATSTAAQLYIAQAPAFTTTYGIYQAGTDPNFLGGNLTVAGNIQTAATGMAAAQPWNLGGARTGVGLVISNDRPAMLCKFRALHFGRT